MRHLLRSAVTSLLLLSCSGATRDWEGIDWAVWKNDPDGCKQERVQYLEALTRQKDKLKSLTEMEIIRLMGRPDQNELYKRNQKFYYYWIEPGTECPSHPDAPRRLIVRFNAIGKAKEVSID